MANEDRIKDELYRMYLSQGGDPDIGLAQMVNLRKFPASGLLIQPDSDSDVTIFKVGVDGDPEMGWDESEDELLLSHSLRANGVLLTGGTPGSVRLATNVAMSGASIDLTTAAWFDGTYKTIEIIIHEMKSDAAYVLRSRVRVASVWVTTGTHYSFGGRHQSSSGSVENRSAAIGYMEWTYGPTPVNHLRLDLHGTITLHAPGAGAGPAKMFRAHIDYVDNGARTSNQYTTGHYDAALGVSGTIPAIDGFRIYPTNASPTITGRYSVVGWPA